MVIYQFSKILFVQNGFEVIIRQITTSKNFPNVYGETLQYVFTVEFSSEQKVCACLV